jgi:hypothetical protein
MDEKRIVLEILEFGLKKVRINDENEIFSHLKDRLGIEFTNETNILIRHCIGEYFTSQSRVLSFKTQYVIYILQYQQAIDTTNTLRELKKLVVTAEEQAYEAKIHADTSLALATRANNQAQKSNKIAIGALIITIAAIFISIIYSQQQIKLAEEANGLSAQANTMSKDKNSEVSLSKENISQILTLDDKDSALTVKLDKIILFLQKKK